MSLTEEQLALRREAYGASQIATIVGEGGGSLMELYAEKLGHPAPESAFDDNLPVQLGRLEEPAICDEYSRRTGTFLAPVTTLRHPKHALILATPDRARFTSEAALLDAARHCATGPLILPSIESLASADRLIEAKRHASRLRRDYGQPGTGNVPAHEAIQAVVQMAVTGLRVVDLTVLFTGEFGCRLDVFPIAWNGDLFEALAEAVERFHVDHVLAGVPPTPDATDRYDETIARLHPYSSAPPLVANVEDEQLMLDYAKFREVSRRAESLKKKLGQQLKLRMGESGGLVSPTLGKLSWTRSKDRTEVDWQAASQNALSLAGQCLNAFDVLTKTGEQLAPENRAALEARLRAIIPEATKTVNGFRSLRFYPKGEAALELARLEIALEALGSGEP